MSQHDMDIGNQGFPATRADLNNALKALASSSSGDGEPTVTYAGMLWFETDTDLLKIRNETNTAWITLAYMNQTTSEWEIRSGVFQAADSGGIEFKTQDGITRITLNNSGNLMPVDASVSLGGASNRFSDGYFSGGIYLGGTGSANKLEDYESGTWTPSLGGTATYTARSGYYVKVGLVVYATFDMTVNSIGNGQNNVINGLPFTAAQINGQAGSVSYWSGAATAMTYLTIRIDVNSSTLAIGGASSATTTASQSIAFWQNGARMVGAITYTAS